MCGSTTPTVRDISIRERDAWGEAEWRNRKEMHQPKKLDAASEFLRERRQWSL